MKTAKPKETFVSARVSRTKKQKAEKILDTIGLSISAAIDSFLSQIILHQGIPYPMEIPNEQTLKDLKDWKDGKGRKRFSNAKTARKIDRPRTD